MVAGIKGVAFVDDDTLALSSSTKGELFIVSRAERKVLKKIMLGDGRVPGLRPAQQARTGGRREGVPVGGRL